MFRRPPELIFFVFRILSLHSSSEAVREKIIVFHVVVFSPGRSTTVFHLSPSPEDLLRSSPVEDRQRSSISLPRQKICVGLLPWKIDNGLPSLSLSLPCFTLARRYIGSSLLTMACQQKNEDATWSQQQPEA